MKRLPVIGAVGFALASYEVAACVFGWPLLSRMRGWPRVAMAGYVGWLGAHLAIEELGDRIGDAAARSFGA